MCKPKTLLLIELWIHAHISGNEPRCASICSRPGVRTVRSWQVVCHSSTYNNYSKKKYFIIFSIFFRTCTIFFWMMAWTSWRQTHRRGRRPTTCRHWSTQHTSAAGTRMASNTIGGIMNGVIKEKLKIIPKDLKWASFLHREYHFPALWPRLDPKFFGFWLL